jgi:D-sedoheptulose 7-phosphate isomerase
MLLMTGNRGEISSPAGYLASLEQLTRQIPCSVIDDIVETLQAAYADGRSVYLYGNGGSAALASHVACDLGKGTAVNGNRRFRVLSLTDNVPLMTAWANDADFQEVFAEQLRHFIQPRDISFAISCSGNSPNVLNALRLSRENHGVNIGLTGFQGGDMKDLCDVCLIVPSDNMQLIEDLHLAIMHSVFTALRHHIVEMVQAVA